MKKDIELEVRAEIFDTDKLLSSLKENNNLISHTKRLSAMFFGKTEAGKFDIRVRVTNGESEVVIKKGGFHANDRKEVSQPIESDQFIGFVRQFSLFDFHTEIAERETFNFDFGNDIVFSLVKAGDIAYAEIEKMTNEENIETDRAALYEVADRYDLTVIEDKETFDELCDRLSEHCDWAFDGSEEHYKKFREKLEEYIS